MKSDITLILHVNPCTTNNNEKDLRTGHCYSTISLTAVELLKSGTKLLQKSISNLVPLLYPLLLHSVLCEVTFDRGKS